MSKRKSKPDALPNTGGSFILGPDGKLVPNNEETVTRPNPGKTVLAAEAEAARKPAKSQTAGQSQAEPNPSTEQEG